jgi:hypothetical protein
VPSKAVSPVELGGHTAITLSDWFGSLERFRRKEQYGEHPRPVTSAKCQFFPHNPHHTKRFRKPSFSSQVKRFMKISPTNSSRKPLPTSTAEDAETACKTEEID